MFGKLTRAALATVAVTAALSLPASAADTADAPRVEYRYFGQGAVVLVIPAPAPYALTGRRAADNTWNTQNVRTIETGQGRVIITPTR